MTTISRTEFRGSSVRVAWRDKIGFNHKSKSSIARTNGALGCEAVLFNALAMVRARRKRSNIVGANIAKIPTTGLVSFAALPVTHDIGHL